MKIGVLGTGMVGTTLAGKLVSLGHEVKMGARDAENPKAKAWASGAGKGAWNGSFADAARFGDVVFNCTLGAAALDALRAAGKDNLKAKVLVDVSNPLEFADGVPRLTTPPGHSLGEQIQTEFPETKVVKALNTVNANVMVNPKRVGGESDLFIAGNDAGAKEKVSALLRDFGWSRIHDLGGIAAARGTEAYLLFWLAAATGMNNYDFNIRVIRP